MTKLSYSLVHHHQVSFFNLTEIMQIDAFDVPDAGMMLLHVVSSCESADGIFVLLICSL